MKNVAKYNLFKGLSTVLTVGTPIITLAFCGNFFRERSATAISAAGVFVILIVALFAKDKIAENFKVPGAFAIALTCLIGLYLVENIIVPMKYVCWATTAAAGIDALTFKNAYKQMEMLLPEQQKAYKHFGFIFTTTKNLEKVASVNGR